MTQDKIALVLGATGSFGGHAAVALQKHGWRVRALTRDVERARAATGPRMPIDWIAGDAMISADVVAAARGASLIVHAVNPPRYRNWAGTVLPMLESSIAAAKASGARILLPGTVYNYAPDAGPAIGEAAPEAPVTRKGKIRAEMERRLEAAWESDGVRSLVLRAGDFFGPAAPNSALKWLTVIGRGEVRAAFRMGSADHAFAYLPDLAETAARLVDREAELAPVERFHFAGQYLAPTALTDSIRRVTGRPRLPVLPFPEPMVWAMAPFDETMREMLEMRYLRTRAIGLDNRKLVAFLGEEPRTPLDLSVAAALADLGVAAAEPRPAPSPRLSLLMA